MFARSKKDQVIAFSNTQSLACPGDVTSLDLLRCQWREFPKPVLRVPKAMHMIISSSTDFSANGETLLSGNEEVLAGAPATDFGSTSASRKTRSRKSAKKESAFSALGRLVSPAHLSGMSLGPLHEAFQSGCSFLPKQDRLLPRHTGHRNVCPAQSSSCYHSYSFLRFRLRNPRQVEASSSPSSLASMPATISPCLKR